MDVITNNNHSVVREYLSNFIYRENDDLFACSSQNTIIDSIEINSEEYPKFINEFWTSKQRQASSLHEIAYRACFKPQLPNFFIKWLTKTGDTIYDPFSGRGTTVIEAALLDRNIIANDINPLSKILCYARLFIPDLVKLDERLENIPIDDKAKADIDLSMFYHPKTEAEIVSLKDYLKKRKEENLEDELDIWIRMVATNRLTGHSSGFFSVYTLPPNQAVSPVSQKKINEKRSQIPDYRDTKKIILKKSRNLLSDVKESQIGRLKNIAEKALFLTEDARYTKEIQDNSVKLTVTSPPFLDVVQYDNDNWLRCWFNSIDAVKIGEKITMPKKVESWCDVMGDVFKELYRITFSSGYVAFEVGEVRNGKVKLEEYVVPSGIKAGFICEGIMINEQIFTKTANIWGVSNNTKGTNTNRIVLFSKL